jgi:DNA primase
MTFPVRFLDEIRSRISVSSIVGQSVKLTRSGREYTGLCPFHNEKSPSFTVNDDKGFMHCFGCGAHGDVITFLMRSRHMAFPDAVEELAGMIGLPVPRSTPSDAEKEAVRASHHSIMEKACAWFEAQLAGEGGSTARAYLADRGITEEAIARFRIGWAPSAGGIARAVGGQPEQLLEVGLQRQGDDGRQRDMFRGRVIFPITDRRGQVIAFGGRVLGDQKPKYLNSPGSVIFDKGATLYGAAHAREGLAKANFGLVVEGYLDVISLHQAGMENVVAPLGTALTDQQLEMLWKTVSTIGICFDADGAGRDAAAKVAWRAMKLLSAGRSIRFVKIIGGKDPDALACEGELAQLREMVAAAGSLTDMIWALLQVKFPQAAPEFDAMFERALHAAASEIPDPITRSRMLGEFRRRLRWQFDDPPEIYIGRSTKLTALLSESPALREEWDHTRKNAERAASRVYPWLQTNGIERPKVEKALGGIGQWSVRAVKGRYAEGSVWPEAPRPALWDFGAGPGRLIFPEWEGGPGTALLDLVAWDPRSNDMATRCGRAIVLNEAAVDLAIGFEARGLAHSVKVAASPLSWLRRMAEGENVILVVDWSRAWDVLGCIRQLDAETVELGELLDKHVRPPRLRRPQIMVEDLG